MNCRGTPLPEGKYIFRLDPDKPNLIIIGQTCLRTTAKLQGCRQIHIVGRGAALGGDSIRREPVNRAGRGTGADGVDDNRLIKADHPLHQPQPAPMVLRNLDLRAVSQQRLEFLDNPKTDAIVGDQGIAETDDKDFHKY